MDEKEEKIKTTDEKLNEEDIAGHTIDSEDNTSVKEDTTNTKIAEDSTKVKNKPKKKHTGLIVLLIVIAFIGIIICLLVPKFLKGQGVGSATVDKSNKASAYSLSGNSLEDFDLYFLQLENNSKNAVYSPLSIKYALAMLNEGTDEETHKQIANIIGEYKAKKYNNNEHMSFANAMYIRDTYKNQIKPEYISILKDKFGAEIFTEDFTSAKPMNDWVSNRTFKLIGDLLDDDSVKGLDYILINALAIDMNWNNKLQCEAAKSDVPCMNYNVEYVHEKYHDSVDYIGMSTPKFSTIDFNGREVDVATIGASINKYDIINELGEDNIRKTVREKLDEYIANGGEMCNQTADEYMDDYIKDLDSNYQRIDQSTDFLFYEDEDVKSFAKDLQTYDGTTLQYVGIMPKKESLDKYIEKIDASQVNNIINNLKPIALDSFKDGVVTKIHGSIPFFKYEYELDLIEDLEKLGITDVFDINKANMSKMIDNSKSYIDTAKHKATIEFSNEGIKAAAATAMGGAGSAGCYSFEYLYDVPVEVIDLTFNKPYIYVIRDKDSGEVWFAGSVYNPEN